MYRLLLPLSVLVLFAACVTKNTTQDFDVWKTEIINTEKAFAEMAMEQGAGAAFIAYADSNAVLNRNNILVQGMSEIQEFYGSRDYSNVELNWTPDFVDVAQSGELAYTYGKYTLSTVDSTGEKRVSTGIFHTVWKRQYDGSWKFVWD